MRRPTRPRRRGPSGREIGDRPGRRAVRMTRRDRSSRRQIDAPRQNELSATNLRGQAADSAGFARFEADRRPTGRPGRQQRRDIQLQRPGRRLQTPRGQLPGDIAFGAVPHGGVDGAQVLQPRFAETQPRVQAQHRQGQRRQRPGRAAQHDRQPAAYAGVVVRDVAQGGGHVAAHAGSQGNHRHRTQPAGPGRIDRRSARRAHRREAPQPVTEPDVDVQIAGHARGLVQRQPGGHRVLYGPQGHARAETELPAPQARNRPPQTVGQTGQPAGHQHTARPEFQVNPQRHRQGGADEHRQPAVLREELADPDQQDGRGRPLGPEILQDLLEFRHQRHQHEASHGDGQKGDGQHIRPDTADRAAARLVLLGRQFLGLFQGRQQPPRSLAGRYQRDGDRRAVRIGRSQRLRQRKPLPQQHGKSLKHPPGPAPSRHRPRRLSRRRVMCASAADRSGADPLVPRPDHARQEHLGAG